MKYRILEKVFHGAETDYRVQYSRFGLFWKDIEYVGDGYYESRRPKTYATKQIAEAAMNKHARELYEVRPAFEERWELVRKYEVDR